MTRRILALLISAGIGWSALATVPSERSSAQSNATGELIHKVRLRMPYGTSVWEDTFPATGSNPLKISFVSEPGCRQSPYVNAYVRVAGTNHWQPTTYTGGYDYYKGGAIEGLRFEINNPYVLGLVCTWKIYANTGLSSPPPVLTQETLLGALSYPGGFVQNLEIAVPSKMVTHFRMAVPAFCQGVEILEASTVTEGVKDKAKLLNKEANLFTVNEESGSRISKIAVTLNGPVATACQIPIFITEK